MLYFQIHNPTCLPRVLPATRKLRSGPYSSLSLTNALSKTAPCLLSISCPTNLISQWPFWHHGSQAILVSVTQEIRLALQCQRPCKPQNPQGNHPADPEVSLVTRTPGHSSLENREETETKVGGGHSKLATQQR